MKMIKLLSGVLAMMVATAALASVTTASSMAGRCRLRIQNRLFMARSRHRGQIYELRRSEVVSRVSRDQGPGGAHTGERDAQPDQETGLLTAASTRSLAQATIAGRPRCIQNQSRAPEVEGGGGGGTHNARVEGSIPPFHQLPNDALMLTFRTRGRKWLARAIAAALVASLAALLLKPMLEHAVRARIESAAVRHGMVARIGWVHVGVWPLLRLEGFDLDLGHGARLHADMIAATWPGRLRLAVRARHSRGPSRCQGQLAGVTAWDVAGIRGEDLQLTLVEPQAGLSIRKLADSAGSAWNVEARGARRRPVCSTCGATRHPLLDGGIADGRVDLRTSTDALRFHVDMGARGARLERWRITPPTNRSSAIRRT